MFGPAGHLYVYFTYGMHWCANAVTGDEGVGQAVLLRALEPLRGLDVMRQRRGFDRSDRDLCRGPARLCEALGVSREHDGLDLTRRSSSAWIGDDGTSFAGEAASSTRIGITKGVDDPWRWYVAGSPYLSRRG
jgi:DNA-3-methyladenine glycosylase